MKRRQFIKDRVIGSAAEVGTGGSAEQPSESGSSSLHTKKINNHDVKPIHVGGDVDKRPILGADLIPHLYSSIFLVAKKNSGKTTVVNHILKTCAGKDTVIYAFAATMYNDPQWFRMKTAFRKKGITFKGYTSMYDSDGRNVISNWLAEQSVTESDNESDDEEEEEEAKLPPPVKQSNIHLLLQEMKKERDAIAGVSIPPEKKERPKRQRKYQAPEAIFIFDDFSKELRDPAIAEFIKRHRHYKTKIIISSQYVKDITPATALNIDIWILFKGLSLPFLNRVYELSSPSVSFEKFKKLYDHATNEPYNFFYADTTAKPEYRKKFDQKYI